MFLRLIPSESVTALLYVEPSYGVLSSPATTPTLLAYLSKVQLLNKLLGAFPKVTVSPLSSYVTLPGPPLIVDCTLYAIEFAPFSGYIELLLVAGSEKLASVIVVLPEPFSSTGLGVPASNAPFLGDLVVTSPPLQTSS